MRLTPDPNNRMHGRAGFLIHGDNGRGDQSASQGCIVLSRTLRDLIGASGDADLEVIGDPARPPPFFNFDALRMGNW